MQQNKNKVKTQTSGDTAQKRGTTTGHQSTTVGSAPEGGGGQRETVKERRQAKIITNSKKKRNELKCTKSIIIRHNNKPICLLKIYKITNELQPTIPQKK